MVMTANLTCCALVATF